MKITHKCTIKFSIHASYVVEVKSEVAPLDTCEVMFDNPYQWDMDAKFYGRENKYHLVKGDKAYHIKAHKGREKIFPLLEKQGQKSKQQVTFYSKRTIDMEKQMAAMCFHVLHGPYFGEQKLPMERYDLNQIFIIYLVKTLYNKMFLAM